jgi:hypothetical protein
MREGRAREDDHEQSQPRRRANWGECVSDAFSSYLPEHTDSADAYSPDLSEAVEDRMPRSRKKTRIRRKKRKRSLSSAAPRKEPCGNEDSDKNKGPESLRDLKRLSAEDRVGVWNSVVTQDALKLDFKFQGTHEVYSVEKLRDALGPGACLPVHTSLLRAFKYVRCLCKGQVGHEAEGEAHRLNEDFHRKWTAKGAEGTGFRQGFRLLQ